MPKISPFLWFDSQAEEAAKFYVSVFPNSKITKTSHYGEGGPGPKGSVMVVEFVIDGQTVLALNGGPQFKFSEAISLNVECKDQAEVDRYWKALTAGGGEEGPCGWLKDKFGLSWQIVPKQLIQLMNSPDRAAAGRAMQAMMKMTKIDVAALQRAHDNA